MKRLDPVHGLAVEEEFLNMESMKTLRSKTLRKPLHILKSNANQPIEKLEEKTKEEVEAGFELAIFRVGAGDDDR